MIGIVGWDIGGVNVKAAWLAVDPDCAPQPRITIRPFEIWHDRNLLPEVLREAFVDVASDESPHAMAVTMSAELSDVFATKREGVQFVLECIHNSFPDCDSHILNLSGELVTLEEARKRPLEFAAANWVASARWISGKYPNCLLIDVGSTTTDIIPILDGIVRVDGRTDTDRLLSGELVYTGALRTNLAAIVQSVPVAGRSCRVASENFTVSGDIHLILGHLRPEDYTCTTPDNRPPTVETARMRLARLVCADAEMLSVFEIDAMARYIFEKQVLQISDGIEQVIDRLPELRKFPVLVLGAGSFMGRAAAKRIGLNIRNTESDYGRKESAALPCVCVAHLLAERMEEATL